MILAAHIAAQARLQTVGQSLSQACSVHLLYRVYKKRYVTLAVTNAVSPMSNTP